MINQKERQILHYLAEKQDEFTTSQELAEQLTCSDRTVRTYLKQLISVASESGGFTIHSKQGYGYRLQIEDRQLFEETLHGPRISSDLLDSRDRYNYILNKLLFEQAELYFDDLAEELFVSRSTLSHEFKKIRKDLEAYDLAIESKANKGVYICGEERNKRRFIMDYYFRDYFFKNMHNYIAGDLTQSLISLEDLTLIVLEECREAQMKLSDFVIQNLVVHIALTLRRIQEGFHIAAIEGMEVDSYQCEQETARKILHRLYQVTGVLFPKEEADYITLHFISKGETAQRRESRIEADSLRQELIQALTLDLGIRDYQFYQDTQLLEGVVTHMMTMLVRLQNQVHLENPLREDIQQHYSQVFQLTKRILESMPSFSSYLISNDEIAYVALHFMAAMERMKERQKYRILVICATGYGSAQLLRNRIERELGNTVYIVDVIGYYDLSDERLENIDFIVSSIDLSNLVFSIPVFTVSVFLTADEARKIKESIKQMRLLARPSRQFVPNQKPGLESVFDQYFSEECFLQADKLSKDTLLRQMAKGLAVGENAGFAKLLLENIYQREQLSSVIFSQRIAVPHPIKPLAKQGKIAVAIVSNGVEWDQEEKNIRLVFLPSPSIYENEGLQLLTSQIVELLEEPDLQEEILTCQSFEEFKGIFLRIGGK